MHDRLQQWNSIRWAICTLDAGLCVATIPFRELDGMLSSIDLGSYAVCCTSKCFHRKSVSRRGKQCSGWFVHVDPMTVDLEAISWMGSTFVHRSLHSILGRSDRLLAMGWGCTQDAQCVVNRMNDSLGLIRGNLCGWASWSNRDPRIARTAWPSKCSECASWRCQDE